MAEPQSDEHLRLGRAVRVLRARRAFSQEELGYRAGLHRNYVGAIERGETNPTFTLLLRLCKASTSACRSWSRSSSASRVSDAPNADPVAHHNRAIRGVYVRRPEGGVRA